MLFFCVRRFESEERRLLSPSNDARQRAKPIPVARGPAHAAGAFRRRSDRHVFGSPFEIGILPDFPSRARRWRLLLASAEVLQSVSPSRAQGSFEFSSD